MARKERRDYPGERDNEQVEGSLAETERESVVALKSILGKVAALVRPLGLNPEESTDIVQRLYEKVLETDMRLAGDPDKVRRQGLLNLVENASIRREDGLLVIDYPS